MNNIIIHIGYHKSASTFLQKDVFPQLPVNYVFLSGPYRQILDMVESDIEFDADSLLKWIIQEIEQKYHGDRKEITIISHEELSGHPHGYRIINPITTAQNLKEAFPNAKILIIIRNQFDYLTSIYTFRVAIKGQECRSFKQFLSEEERMGLFDHLEYHRLIKYYIELFGRERVLVLPMEYLKMSPDEFLRELTDFMEVPIELVSKHRPRNVSTKLIYVLSIWRPINYIFYHLLLVMLFLSGKDKSQFEPDVYKGYYPFIRLRYAYYAFKGRTTKFLNKIFSGTRPINIESYSNYHQLVDRFGKSNDHLEEMIGFDLTEFKYPVRNTKKNNSNKGIENKPRNPRKRL